MGFSLVKEQQPTISESVRFVPVDGGNSFGPKSGVLRQLSDIPIGLAGGVAGLVNAGLGLGDIATGGQVGNAVDAAGSLADKIGLPDALRPTKWQDKIQSYYTPEMKAAKAAAHQSAVDAEQQAKDDGSGAMGQIGAGALGALKGAAENPRAGLAFITENYGGMKAIAKGTEKVLARYLPEIDAAVKAGTMTQAQANARVADLAGKISPVGEGILTAGQGAQQVRSENPNATAADYLLQAPAGFITGAIARGVGRIPGLENVEATMALNAMGRPSGFTGGVLKRAGKGVLSEGVLQEVPQSAQEQAWVNAATGKPLQEGVGESAVQGLIAGGAMGGGAAGMSGVAEHLRAPAQGNVDPAAVPAQPSTTGGPAQDSSAQALVAEALAAETAAQPATTSSAPAGDHPLAAPIAQTNKAGPAGATISTTNEGEQQNGDQAQVTLAQQAGQQEVGEAATDPAGRADQSAEGGGNVPGAGRQGVAAEAQKAETRADFYERLADEREQPGPAADPGRAAQYRAKADKLRADAVARIAQGFTGSDQPTTSGALPQQSTAMPVPDAWKAAKLSPAKEMLSSNPKLAPTVKENFAADPAAKAVGISAVRAKQSPIQKRDDLVGAIMRVTGGAGINSSMALDTTGDDAGKAARLRGMFTARGTIDLDDTAHLLRVEEGYDVRDGAHLAELIRQAAAGDVPVSMERMIRDKEADQERQHRDRIRAKAKKLGIRTVGVTFSDVDAAVLEADRRRHDLAVEKLTERDKKRFDAAVKQLESLVSDAERQSILQDIDERGLSGREKWQEATRLLRQFAADASGLQGEFDNATSEEPDWFKDFDEETDNGTGPAGSFAAGDGGAEAVGRGVQDSQEQGRGHGERSGIRGGSEADGQGDGQEARFELTGQSAAEVADDEAAKAAAKKAADDADAKDAADKKAVEKKAAEDKIKARAEDPDNFQFGEDSKAAANPMGGLFDQPSQPDVALKNSGGSLDSLIPTSFGLNVETEGKTWRQFVEGVFDKHGMASYIYEGSLYWPSGTHGKSYGARIPPFAADHYEKYRDGEFDRKAQPAKTASPDQDYAEGDRVRFTPHDESESRPVIEGILVQKASTSGGNFRLRIRTDLAAPQGGGNVTRQFYSQNGTVERIGDGLNAPRDRLNMTPDQAAQHRIDMLAKEFTSTIYEESKTDDFDPAEVPAGARDWAKDAGLDERSFIESVISAVEKETFRRKAGVLAALRASFPAQSAKPELIAESIEPEPAAKPEADDTRFNVESAPFYSALSREISAVNIKSAPAVSWKLAIRGLINSGKVKADEVEWSGLNEWMDLQQGKITKDQVSAFIDANGVQVHEVVLGKDGKANDAYGWGALNDEHPDGTKYGQYQLPGGENYREVLLTLPYIDRHLRAAQSFIDRMVKKYGKSQIALSGKGKGWRAEMSQSERAEYDRLSENAQEPIVEFKSPHWNQPNVLAHIRVNDRTDADGNRVLFVEELQSDWGQKGKKDGFKGTPEGAKRFFGINDDAWSKMDDVERQSYVAEMVSKRGAVPSAPFVTNTDKWLALALKRIIKMAADGGYDRVAFVNGEQSAERYDLSKHIQSVRWWKDGIGRYNFAAFNGGKEVMRQVSKDADEVADYLGKEVAQKIVDGVGVEKMANTSNEQMWGKGNTGLLESLDLKVGGEGMRAFYDKIVPAAVKSVTKKLGGGQAGEVRLLSSGSWTYSDIRALSDDITAMVYGRGTTYDSLPAESQAKIREMVKKRELIQPGFDITPTMRERAAGGMPLFNRNGHSNIAPSDSAIYDMAGEGKSAAEILSFIGKASRRPFNRYLANALARMGVSSTVKLDSQGGWKFNSGKPGQKYAAAYNPKTDAVALFTPREAERHVLHELVHAATLKAIAKGGPAATQMKALFEHLQSLPDLAGQYGMTNLDEFVAEAFSNPLFQQALKRAPAPRGSSLKSAWDAFVRMVARMLGFKSQPMESALDRAMVLGAELMRENSQLSGKADGTRYSVSQIPTKMNMNKLRELQLNMAHDAEMFYDKHPWASHKTAASYASSWAGLARDKIREIANLEKDLKAVARGETPAPMFDFLEQPPNAELEAQTKDRIMRFKDMLANYQVKAKQAAEEWRELVRNNPEVAAAAGISTNDLRFSQESDTINVDGADRPRTNSNGKPIAQDEASIRRFWEWFGDSQVVDEQGRPLVVYHGTRGDFDSFSLGDEIHVTADAELASQYASAERGRDGNPNVMAVYASITNPMHIDGAPSSKDVLLARKNGHDGFEVGDEGHYAALRPEQIKSATGNNGQFSPDNPDIRFNVASTQPAVTPPVSPGNAWQRAKAKAAEILSPKNLDKIIYEMQDKYVDLKRLRDHIKAIGGTITDMNDAYLGEELYHQRLAYRTEKFAADELLPLQAEMRAKGISQSELETFLHARHAPEANAEMAKRNPNQSEIDAGRNQAADAVRDLELQLQRAKATGAATHALERALNDARGELVKWNGAQAFRGTEEERTSLSGMSDAASAAILAGLTPRRRAELDALAVRVDAINEGTLQLLDDYGLMPKAALTAWRNTYQHYIPLHRDEAHPDSLSHPIGQGFNVKGDAAKRRTGSNQKVTNILGHIAMQREAALTRGEKNHVMLKLYLMARQNPLPDVWKVGSVPTIDTIDKATGFVKSVPDPLYKTRPNVLVLRVGGKDVAITINEHNPEELRMAHALKNLDVDDLHYLIPVVGKATRWFASMNTQYNPIFGIINLMRDTQEAALNLSTTELAGKQGEILKDQLSILKEVLQNKGRMPKTGKWAALFAELKEVGGTTGYRDLFLDAESRGKALQDTLKSLDRGKASQAAHAVAEWLSDYNEAMENATRLAAYKAGIDSGMSKERAASLAKNLTVNFNRKGRQTRELGALYAFFNAAVQGTTRMAQTLAGPAGRKIMAGGVLIGALNALLGIAMMGGGDGDDDEWEKIPEFVKERSIIIPIGKQDYLSIPMPLGFQFLPNIGRLAVEMAVYKDKTAGKQMASLFTVLADAFNPLGGSSPPMQIIAPTVMDPFVALAQNKDWTGRPIYIENRNNLDPKPGLQRSKDSATPWAKGLAEAINAITGGTEYTPGGWSPTPDQIDYVIGQLTGGVGREAGKVASTAAAPFTGEELPAHKIPLAGRLYGSTSGTSGQSEKFYENITRANEAENEIKGRLKSGRGVAEYLQENPRAMDLAAQGNAAERQASLLRKMRSGIIEQDPPDKVERVREINSQIAAVMRGFNRAASVQ